MCTVIMFSPACFRMSNIPLKPAHNEHKKSGCSYAKEQPIFSQTAARKTTLTGQQPTPTWTTFVTRNRQDAAPRTFTTSASPDNLQEHQLEVYTTIKDHYENNNPTPLCMIVTGTAGTGKSYLIHCIRLLLGDTLKVSAPTGVASFIIEGTTLHYTFQQEESSISYREIVSNTSNKQCLPQDT